MDYYKRNAIYDFIDGNRLENFKFCSGNMWQLVYGDNKCSPKLLVFVVGVNNERYDLDFSEKEKEAFFLLNNLAVKCNLPVRVIKFNSEDNSIEKIKIYEDVNSDFKDLSLMKLKDVFKEYGLPISDSATAKYLNDRTSSAYHKWQRGHLGRDLTVSDIDLWKLNPDGNVQRIYELKRSYYSIERWSPFPDDYRNFRLLSNMANIANIRFGIVYNVRQKNPFYDDISSIKVFRVDFSHRIPIVIVGVYDTNGFFNL
jgi:hypothetical protein